MPLGIRLEGCIPCFGRLQMTATYHSIISTVKLHGKFAWSFLGTFPLKSLTDAGISLALYPEISKWRMPIVNKTLNLTYLLELLKKDLSKVEDPYLSTYSYIKR